MLQPPGERSRGLPAGPDVPARAASELDAAGVSRTGGLHVRICQRTAGHRDKPSGAVCLQAFRDDGGDAPSGHPGLLRQRTLDSVRVRHRPGRRGNPCRLCGLAPERRVPDPVPGGAWDASADLPERGGEPGGRGFRRLSGRGRGNEGLCVYGSAGKARPGWHPSPRPAGGRQVRQWTERLRGDGFRRAGDPCTLRRLLHQPGAGGGQPAPGNRHLRCGNSGRRRPQGLERDPRPPGNPRRERDGKDRVLHLLLPYLRAPGMPERGRPLLERLRQPGP